MKLYYMAGACSFAAHLALREAGADFALVRFDKKSQRLEGGGLLDEVNDKGLVPVLELDDGQRLTEVAAVLQYIADRAPERQLAPPAGTMERYRLVEWLSFLGTEVHKLFWPLFHDGTDEESRKAREILSARFAWIENKLGDRSFLVGETFTVADAYLFTILTWTKAAGIDLGPWPNLKAYRSRIRERPTVTAALEAEGLLRR
jgi:glutathione S-transferase